MDEVFEQYGETILYTVLGIMFLPLGWCLLRVLGTI